MSSFGLNLENHFARLGSQFFTAMPAEKVGDAPQLVHANPAAAALIDLDPKVFADPAFTQVMAGHKPLEGFESLAMVYSGHQFGVWAGQLGDGRALMIGQVRNAKGELWDIQLKGAGKTPYSRFGDGRAVMRSSIREYLCGEAMAALGIPTSRALSLVFTGEAVMREKPEPGAVIARLAPSHVRFGNFEHFHYAGNTDAVRELADHVIAEHFPGLVGKGLAHAAFYGEVVRRTAVMIAYWQAVGFAHGVMNTDNMSILGLTLDYGPFGFMDAYDPEFICNHTDEQGRYSVINQPGIAHWNLRALAVALSRLVPAQTLVEELNKFEGWFAAEYRRLMRAKLGLAREEEGDDRLIGELLAAMAKGRADYTLTFRDLPRAGEAWAARFGNARAEAENWLQRWRARTAGEDLSGLDRVNPKYVLRNWVAETAIRAVEDRGDIATFDRIFRLLQTPFDDHPEDEEFAAPPPAAMCGLEVSCSS
jgi:uncharacterized protein YdiU (UPF0061 family)